MSHTDELTQFIDKHTTTWSKDNTLGLVLQCGKRFHRQQLCSLQKTYSKISLSDAAKLTNINGVAAVEAYIIEAVERGAVSARICQRDGVLLFEEDPHVHRSAATTIELDERATALIELDTALNHLDEMIVTSTKYIKRNLKASNEEKIETRNG